MPSYLIAGASRGLGFQFVQTLSKEPSNVVIGLYRSDGTAQGLLALAKEKSNVHAVKADIDNIASLRAAAEATAKITDGTLDVLINNAAYMDSKQGFIPLPGWAGREEELETYLGTFFHTNATAVVLTTNIFLPLLRKGTGKKVVNISTGMSDPAFSLQTGILGPAYAMSKAALNLATVSQAVALKEEGFIVFALSPGLVNTATEPPSEEELQGFKVMVERFQAVYPEWDGVPLTPEVSVDLCLKVIEGVKADQSGQMLSHKGNTEWL